MDNKNHIGDTVRIRRPLRVYTDELGKIGALVVGRDDHNDGGKRLIVSCQT